MKKNELEEKFSLWETTTKSTESTSLIILFTPPMKAIHDLPNLVILALHCRLQIHCSREPIESMSAWNKRKISFPHPQNNYQRYRPYFLARHQLSFSIQPPLFCCYPIWVSSMSVRKQEIREDCKRNSTKLNLVDA